MLTETTDFCRLILLRHPELDPAFANLAVGAGQARLGRRGQAQILRWMKVLDTLPISAIYCAPQSHCLEPARALGTHRQVDVTEESRLADQAMGTWEGRSWDELVEAEGPAVQEFFANLGESAAPGGESLGTAVERMLSWWSEVSAKSLHATLVVVTSGGMISGFATAMLGMRLSRCVSLNLPHGGVGVLDCFANGVRIASWNPDALSTLDALRGGDDSTC